MHVNLGTGQITALRLPPREQAAAIDGLYWHDGHLVGIQNVTTPGRVVRLTLAADGTTVTRIETLQSHHQPAFHEPTTEATRRLGREARRTPQFTVDFHHDKEQP